MAIILSSLTVNFLRTGYKLLQKTLLNKGLDEYLILWAITLGTIVISLLLLVIPIPKTDWLFWAVCIGSALSWLIGDILDIKATKITDISIIAPIYAFGIIFTGILAWIILGEIPSLIGFIGIILIIIGAYFLELREFNINKIHLPFKIIFTNKGTWLILIAFFFYSLNNVLDKIGIAHTNNLLFYGIINHIIAMTIFTIIIHKKIISNKKVILDNKTSLIILGILNLTFSLIGLSLYKFMEVVYVAAIFNLSILFEIIGGHFMFKEDNFRNRLIAGLLIILGITLIFMDKIQ
ncbi:MAG: hypothetical protein QT05_C0052G0046 [archaeon GW2011_AR13]|nr:MAG: hypothetical protein QT05_C0052G0046 [archaeon GW2011_AR13]HIG94277.1 EamA family transporter [Nanoarchaeota archaeon]HIH63176.1 EamA family transporter [Nanoarchaeota archaeon]HIJ09207.1 EamA family transporter [Nanoarchaeota archaeon]